MQLRFYIFVILTGLGLSNCRNTVVFNGEPVELVFSQDTVLLDTVFTGLGSSTRLLKVYNPSAENINVDRVFLGRGASSFYRMNVDGVSGRSLDNLEILAGDSAYLFIEITPDAGGANEMVYEDSIVFENGPYSQSVRLITAVWDAYYHFPNRVLTIAQPEPYPDIKIPYGILPCNSHWSNDKPHVIYGYAVVDSACSLTIDEGTQVHVHNGGGIWIYKDGLLRVDATATSSPDNLSNPVIFQGDRLEPGYEWVPGQWGGVLGGIFMMESTAGPQILKNTIIKNATTGIRLDSAAELELENVIVTHSSRVNFYGGFGQAELVNTLLGPAGVYSFYGLGGQYNVINSTILNGWTFSGREGTALGLSNYFEDGNGVRYGRDLLANFTGSIIDGTLDNEVGLAIDGSASFNVRFDHSALIIDPNPDGGHYSLEDTIMFSGTNLYNGFWNYVEGPVLEGAGFEYVPDSVSVLHGRIGPSPQTPPYDMHGTLRNALITVGASNPL